MSKSPSLCLSLSVMWDLTWVLNSSVVSSGDNPHRSASVSTGTFDLSETRCVCQCQSSFPGCSAQAGEVMGSFVGASQPLKSFSSDVKAIKRFSQVTELPRFGSRLLNASTLVLSQIPLDAIAHQWTEFSGFGAGVALLN